MTYKTDPTNPDTDGDSILLLDKNGQPLIVLTDYDEVKGNTDPLLYDTDGDGISDGLEIYLGSGKSTDFAAIPLDPLSNDTDNDGLEDGQEISVTLSRLSGNIANVTIQFDYNSSPVLADTDADGVLDGVEVKNRMRADYWDTDNDQISDYDELYTYEGISPTDPDTDTDGIPDTLELLNNTNTGELVHLQNVNFTQVSEIMGDEFSVDPALLPQGFVIQQIPVQFYDTYSWEPDTDGDLLPDGAEIAIYQPNYPNMRPEVGYNDTNGNGIIDGLDFDHDDDGLEDGLEFSGPYPTVDVLGGIFSPDSDRDAIMDGDEYYRLGTMPNNPDSDNDTYTDGFELLVGTDPLVFTSSQEMEARLRELRGPLLTISPRLGGEYNVSNIPLVAFNITSLTEAWYRYRLLDQPSFGNNISLSYTNSSNPGFWVDLSSSFDSEGVYVLETFGRKYNGEIVKDQILFAINASLSTLDPTTLAQYGVDPLTISLVIGALAISGGGIVVILRKQSGGP